MSESNAVTAAVSDMVDAMNRGDFAAATGAFGATPVIVETSLRSDGKDLTRRQPGLLRWLQMPRGSMSER